MINTRRIMAMTLAAACLLAPQSLSTLAENAEVSAANFAPDETMEVGSHGEVDQSAFVDLPTVEPLEVFEEGDTTATEEPLLEDNIDYDGAAESNNRGDDYVDSDDILPDNDNTGIDFDNNTEPNQIAEANEGGPSATNMPVVDVSSMQFSALTDASLGFTFNYPSNWDNIPGLHTVCFREPVEKGDFPARIAVTVKKMTHSVLPDVMVEQLTKYMRTISKQYEPKTFQAGKVNKADSFMGRTAYSNVYLAYSGETEVMGFIIGTTVGKAIVVGHFSATYEEYQSMYNVMRYMIGSVQLLSKADGSK